MQYVPVSEIDLRISVIEEQLVTLPLELDVLRRLRSQAIALPGEHGSGEWQTEKVGPKQSVLRFLAAQHVPTEFAVVIREVEPVVDSSATDVKRTLYSTISNLKSAGLVRVVDGHVFITEDGLKESKKAVKVSRQ